MAQCKTSSDAQSLGKALKLALNQNGSTFQKMMSSLVGSGIWVAHTLGTSDINYFSVSVRVEHSRRGYDSTGLSSVGGTVQNTRDIN
jgi:hypothetical protein